MTIAGDIVSKDWERLEDERDALAGLLARMETANEETIPLAVIERLSRCESPLRVWREYRQLEIADLAAEAGIPVERLSAAETGLDLGLRELSAICRVLRVKLDDLVPWSEKGEPTDSRD